MSHILGTVERINMLEKQSILYWRGKSKLAGAAVILSRFFSVLKFLFSFSLISFQLAYFEFKTDNWRGRMTFFFSPWHFSYFPHYCWGLSNLFWDVFFTYQMLNLPFAFILTAHISKSER